MKKIVIALDNLTEDEIFSFLSKWPTDFRPTVKIGLEMFCMKGPEFVKKVFNQTGADIFLDLKLHDIPQTVKKSIKSLAGLPITLLTVHLSGGKKMLEMAQEQAEISLPGTTILGVSYLTSLDVNDFSEIWGVKEDQIGEAFERLFNLAFTSGIGGVVSSAQELELLKSLEAKHGRKLLKVTPGIRFLDEISGGNTQDQKRVETPASALKKGANFLVIGRSLTKAENLNERIETLKKLL
ncbi:MAG: orotidine-5'-phosphate decarboxylase [Epsilonproteobacteria bacterium]|nr:MAG: orotidine-5'-phosphate decarboxylase [Campylobacterota bacterium]RLA67102.1 MAG: orotidine-5'-phosphate decarboxylase [Campylobacterota bacterium]